MIRTISHILIFLFITLPFSGYAQSPDKPAAVEEKSLNVAVDNKKSEIIIRIKLPEKNAAATLSAKAAEKSDKQKDENPPIDDTKIEKLATNPFQTVSNGIKDWIALQVNVNEISWWMLIYLFIGILLTLITGRIVRWIIEHHLVRFSKKTATEVDDKIWEALGRPSSLLIFSLGIYLSSGPLIPHLAPGLKTLFARLCLATAASSVAWALYRMITVIDYILTKLAEKTENNLDDLIVAIIRKSLKVTIVLVSVLFIGQNILNLNITTFLAGAGVLGLAVAFAAQDTIANFFGSIMIILDQPFKVGDCISLQGFKGTVEYVGFRSTRIRTFDGHLISLPNKGVANESIENIAQRPYIKKVFNLGLTYDTGYDNMEKAVNLLHKLLDKQPCMHPERMPRIVFDSFNDFSLNISVTVWWHDRDDSGNFTAPDYGQFIKWVHETDMEILKLFDSEGLEFAFPTNTTYFAYDRKRQVTLNIQNKNSK